MYYLDAFNALLQVDFSWFMWLVQANIFWIFAFVALGTLLFPQKKIMYSFVFIVLSIWAWADFTKAMGWATTDANYLSLNMIATIVVLAFAESTKRLKGHFLIINQIRFIVILAAFNLFIR